MAIIYKIRRKSDGLFSKGGISPRFTKKGKTWNHTGYLKSHLKLVRQCDYNDCEIVTIEVTEYEIAPTVALPDYFKDVRMKQMEKEKKRLEDLKKRKEKAALFEKEQRHQVYLKLQKEFR